MSPGKRSVFLSSAILIVLFVLAPCHLAALAPGVKVVPIPGTDMRFSSARNILYVAVPAYGGDRANSLTKVNPATGALLGSIPLPGDPVVVAMSADQKFLYVGLMDGNISRIDLDTQQVDLTFSPGQSGVAGAGWVVDIEVFPDRPESIVASFETLDPFPGSIFAVFDNGVMRPQTAQPLMGPSEVTFGSDSQTLWGAIGDTDTSPLYRLTVSPTGISVVEEPNSTSLFRDYGINPLFHAGNVIARDTVFDPETQTMLGRFYGSASLSAESFAMDEQTSRIYFAFASKYHFLISEYDLTSFRLTGEFSCVVQDSGVPSDMPPERTVTCGAAGIAMCGFGIDFPHITIFPHSLFQRPDHWTPPAPAPLNDQIRRIPLENAGIVADPNHSRIYASLPNWAYDVGNSVAAIDCVQGTVSPPVWVGADPWQMAVSAESKYLYVALYNGWAVQRLTLPNLTPDLRIPLKSEKVQGLGMFPARVNEMLAFPDSPESFVVARCTDPAGPTGTLGVVAYDGGVKRAKATVGWPFDESPSSIQWSESGTSLYGFPDFRELSVTAEGVELDWATKGVTSKIWEHDLMACQYGLCFTPAGHIIDGATQERITQFRFDFSSEDFEWPVDILPDLDRGLVYFLSCPYWAPEPPTRVVLEAFDVKTCRRAGKLIIPVQSAPSGFVKWRDDQLAVATSDEVILFPLSLLHNRPKLPQPVTDLRPALRLVFPFLEENDTTLTGLAVSNLTTSPANLTWSASDSLGNSNQFEQNSVPWDLPAGTQRARTAAEIFGKPIQYCYAEVTSDNPGVSGFFLERRQGGLDGGIGVSEPSRLLYFPRVTTGLNSFRGRTPRTIVYITNPNGFAVDVELNYVPTEPEEYIGRKVWRWVTLPAKSVYIFDVSSAAWSPVDATSGYVKAEVTSPRGGVTGFERIELMADPTTQITLDTLIALDAVEPSSATRFYSAQLAVGSDVFTSLKLLNVSDATRHIQLRAIGQDGAPLAPPAELDIEPNCTIEKDLEEIFNFYVQGELLVGSLIAESDAPGIVGNVVFGDPTTLNYSASLALQSRPFKKAVFGHVANVADFFTGLALFNPGAVTAQIRIEAFLADGHKNGEKLLELGPGERAAQLLTELIPSTNDQAGGYVVVSSTVAVVGQQLFGNFGLTMMSAVPPKVLVGSQ